MAIRGEREKSLTKMPLLLPPAAFFASGLAKRPSSSLSRCRVMGRDEQSETRGSQSEEEREQGGRRGGSKPTLSLSGWDGDPIRSVQRTHNEV